MKRHLKIGGRLDRYVARLFGLSYLTAFFLVVGLFVIIDMTANLEDYLEPGEDGSAPSTLDVGHFYLLQLPFLYLQVSPFVTLAAGLFTSARMSRSNELVSVLNAGISARRMLLPVFAASLALAVGMFALREWATSELGSRRDAMKDYLLERRPVPLFEGFWVADENMRQVRIQEYRARTPDGKPPEIRGLSSRFERAGEAVSISAERAVWSDRARRWDVENALRFEVDASEKRRSTIEDLGELRFTPDDVELAWKGRTQPLERSFTETLKLLERSPSDTRFRTLFHYHLTFPFAGVVLLLVGLPFVIDQRRGHGLERVAAGFIVCVGYFGLDLVSRTLGMDGQIGPILSGWFPILFFGSLGAVLFGSMRS